MQTVQVEELKELVAVWKGKAQKGGSPNTGTGSPGGGQNGGGGSGHPLTSNEAEVMHLTQALGDASAAHAEAVSVLKVRSLSFPPLLLPLPLSSSFLYVCLQLLY